MGLERTFLPLPLRVDVAKVHIHDIHDYHQHLAYRFKKCTPLHVGHVLGKMGLSLSLRFFET